VNPVEVRNGRKRRFASPREAQLAIVRSTKTRGHRKEQTGRVVEKCHKKQKDQYEIGEDHQREEFQKQKGGERTAREKYQTRLRHAGARHSPRDTRVAESRKRV